MGLTESNLTGAAIRILLLLWLLPAVASYARAERLPIRAYTTADGLANNRIGRILRDSHGFMWFCTTNGLSRFDGSRFKTYNVEDGLPNSSSYDLLETRDGNYWVATNGGGVARFNFPGDSRPMNQDGSPSRFTVYPIGDNPVSNRVNNLFEDKEGVLWAGTDGGLFSMNRAKGEREFHGVELGIASHADLTVQVWDFAEDDTGIWIGTKFGLVHRLTDGRMIHYEVQPSKVSDVVLSLMKDDEGNLWMSHDTGVIAFNLPPTFELQIKPGQALKLPSNARRYTTANGLGGNRTIAIFKSSSGRIWVSDTSPALNEFDGKAFRSYPIKQFTGTDHIVAIAEDTADNLWLGTNANGVLRFARQGFVTYDTSDGLGEVIGSIFENHAGELYVNSRNWIISRFDGERFISVKPSLPNSVTEAGWRSSTAILQDRAGEWWLGTRAGLYRFPNVERIEQLATARPKGVYTRKDGLAGDDITSLFEDSRGDIWIAHFAPGTEVLTRWERATETFHSYSEADGLQPFTAPSSFGEDAAGNLWIGIREGGLARYANGRFTILKEDDGFPSGKSVRLYLDQSGRLWCTLSDGRLCRIDDPQAARLNVVQYTKKEGLGKGPFYNIIGDGSGRIYVGNSQGIDMLDPASGYIKHYTPTDGLTIGEPTAAFRDRQGKLWFGTNKGLSRFSPQPERDISPPPVFINDLSIAGITYQVSPLGEKEISGLEIEPSQNQIQIDFFGMSFGLGEALRYQYKLEGSSVDWSAPSDQRSVNYAILPSGSYRFLVRAVNSIGVPSESPAIVAFRIIPPVWRRWWFLLTVAFIIVAVVSAFARYRYQRIKAVREAEGALRRSREERLQELERVRRRIATDLHDDIGSSLTQISILSEVARQRIDHDSQLSGPLSMIASASRELVDSMSDIVWAINPQKDHLSDLTQRMRRFASDVLTARNIAFEFHEPDEESDVEMGANIRREVFLIFKESVNNLVRHSDCSEAEIDFQIAEETLKLRVRDNGKGFDTFQDSEGHGLASMRQRAAGLGGKLEIFSRKGEGTIVTLELPLNRQA